MAAEKAKPKKRASRRLLRLFPSFWVLVVLFIVFLELAFVNLLLLVSDLPAISSIDKFQPPLMTEVYDSHDILIDSFSSERRRLIDPRILPRDVINAFLAAEDAQFYSHRGIDFPGIIRAAYSNYRHGEVKQGASTITQQVVRAILLSRERTIERKAKEALLSLFLERKMPKENILCIYLNLIYFGSGAYGVEEAALTYFGVPAKDLTIAQAAMIAGVIQAPGRLSPRDNFPAAKKRQEWVIGQMVKHGFISGEKGGQALAEEIKLAAPVPSLEQQAAPYYADAVRSELVKILGDEGYARGGYKVYTALDQDLQTEAEAAVRRGVERLNGSAGHWGVPVRQMPEEDRNRFLDDKEAEFKRLPEPYRPGDLLEALIADYQNGQVTLLVGRRRTEVPLSSTPWSPPSATARKGRARRWSRELPLGYVVSARVVTVEPLTLKLVQKPSIESALVSMDPYTREVKALVGGYDYALNQYDRALLARRPPGSAMKPIVYSAAFSSRKFTPATVIVDNGAPIALEGGGFWHPKNYSGSFYGPTSLHYALVNSRNVVTAKLASYIGVQAVIDRAHLLGVDEDFPHALSISLGAYGVSLMELANAYAVFASEGVYQKPVFITHIVDRNGNVIYTAPLIPNRVLSTGEAYQMTYILNKVTVSGTATHAQAIGHTCSGKTGTTSDFRDSWFMGYTPQLVTGVWVGRDDFRPMHYGLTGSKGALPIWVDYMKDALASQPKVWYTPPEDVYFKYNLCFLEGTQSNSPVIGGGGEEDREDLLQKPEDELLTNGQGVPPEGGPVGDAVADSPKTGDHAPSEQPLATGAGSLLSGPGENKKAAEKTDTKTAPADSGPAEEHHTSDSGAVSRVEHESSSPSDDDQSRGKKLWNQLKNKKSASAPENDSGDGHY
jgi:penicillin-binding protein 1A